MTQTLKNTDLRAAMIQAGVRQWQVAEALGCHEVSLSRRMRHELPDDEKERIMEIIHDLSTKDETK